MCYSGICKQENHMGDCTWYHYLPLPCPDEVCGPLDEEEQEEKRILERIW